MQNLMLSSKMTLFLGFGASAWCREQLKITKSYFFTSAAEIENSGRPPVGARPFSIRLGDRFPSKSEFFNEYLVVKDQGNDEEAAAVAHVQEVTCGAGFVGPRVVDRPRKPIAIEELTVKKRIPPIEELIVVCSHAEFLTTKKFPA